MRATRIPIALFIVLLALPSCDGTTAPEPPPPAVTSLAVVDGNSQRAPAGTPLPAPLRVKATDADGNVVAGAIVTFAVVDGGGSLAPETAITGSDGIAESSWTLGTTAVRQHVRALTGDIDAQFTADACQPGPCNSELAYEDNGDIMIFNAATGGTRQVASRDSLTWNQTPAWSPDGERIAFTRLSYSEGTRSIYVMNSDGTAVSQVTGPDFLSPTWSPQGDALAFVGPINQPCPADQYCGAIYVQELAAGSVMRLVAASGFAPAWSPDGSRIAFVARNGSYDNDDLVHSLRLVNPTGSGMTEIVPLTSAWISRPTWSPDGTRIAFSMNGVIYVIRADGTGQTQLTLGGMPAWSPDGTRIAYYSIDNNGNDRIMEIPAEGGAPTLLTSGIWPSWRP
ncbi:MAG TPA: LpqB family beta-propeller domain-containing protein [Gemmatimonadaceae bacterium]|nr:LpqB family beta-propeller domain-containing protein [Gemmatimonadaceae bacterium]